MRKIITYIIIVLLSFITVGLYNVFLTEKPMTGYIAFVLFLAFYFGLWTSLSFLRSKIGVLNALFVVIFIGSLFIPILKIDDSDRSVKENRMLAKYPKINKVDDLYNYGNAFDLWFNDHLLGRNQLLSLHDDMLDLLRGEENQSDIFTRALVGKNGWLFYKGNHSLENYANTLTIKEEDLNNLLTYLENVDNWCNENGIKFYFALCPDKNRVYGEYLSFVNKVNPDSMSRANCIMRAIKERTSIKSVYLLNRLLKEKDNGLLYYKNDTHWSLLGCYYGSLELMKLMSSDMDIQPVACDSFETYTYLHGDLSSMCPNVKDDSVTRYKSPIFRKTKGEKVETGFCRRFYNPNRQKGVFIVGDSYSLRMGDMLTYSFSLVERKTEREDQKFVWQMTKEDLNYIKAHNFDALVFEVVERYCDRLAYCKFPIE